MSAPSASQDSPFRPLHELLADMNIRGKSFLFVGEFTKRNVTDETSNTITWTCRTTEESVTITRAPPTSGQATNKPVSGIQSSLPSSAVTHASSISTPRQQKRTPMAESSKKPVSAYTAPIPHPSCILPPKRGTTVQDYYVITVGQEVGIFYTWYVSLTVRCYFIYSLYRPEVAARTNNISGNAHKRYSSFPQALNAYEKMYNKGCVRAVPVPGGPFWPFDEQSDGDSSRSSSPTSSVEFWSKVGDISAESIASVP